MGAYEVCTFEWLNEVMQKVKVIEPEFELIRQILIKQ
jgi:hypothetical protein